MDKNKSFTTKG